MIDWFVDNPVKVAVGVLLLALFGSIALVRMPIQLTPEVQRPTLTVRTRWPGASPQEVEREIVSEQEEQLKSVEGVQRMTSESMDSTGQIELEFAVGTDMQEALLKVNTRLQQVASYPVDANEPVLQTSSSGDRPIAWFLLGPNLPERAEIARTIERHPEHGDALRRVLRTDDSGLFLVRLREAVAGHPELESLLPPDIDIQKMRRFAEDVIEARFERVTGISNSNVLGGREEELQVIVDAEKMASRGVTVADLRRVLRAWNRDTSAGDFDEGKRRYIVRTLGQFRSPEEVQQVLVAYADGRPVYVGDVAEVRLGHKKVDGIVRRFGQTSIAINAQRETGANVIDVMAGLQEAAAELNEGVLERRGLHLEQVYDETDYIESAVGLVRQNLVVGGCLTVIVLLIFLKSPRSTLIVALAIPASLIGTFLVLGILGRSLNVISLAGLAFAVGMLVDNAVVVLENIYRLHQGGLEPRRAAIDGTREVIGAVFASTATTLAVFLPVLFVAEEAGQLFRDIALAISAAVGLSFLISLTVIPTAAARVLPRHDAESPGRFGRIVRAPGRLAGWLFRLALWPIDQLGRLGTRLIVALDRITIRFVALRLVVVVGLVGASLWGSQRLLPRVEYLPSGNRNLVIGIILPPPGYNIDQLVEMGETIEARLRPHWDVDFDDPTLADRETPVIGDFFFVARGRSVFLGLRARDPQRAAELEGLVRSVSGGLPGTFVIAKQTSLFEQGLTGGRTIDIEITGSDLTQLVGLGGRILGQVQGAVPAAQARPKPSLDLSSPEVHIRPDLARATDVGLTAEDLGYTVNALVDGAYAADYFVGGNKIDLTILGAGRHVRRTQDLEEMPIATPTGDLVALSSVASVALGSGPEQINHSERRRTITIEVSPPESIALEEAMESIESQIIAPIEASGQLGDARLTLSGTADKLRSTWVALRYNLVLALLITYLLMAALFESWTQPLVIITSVPLGAVGGLGALWLLDRYVVHQPLDVLTLLGFVILIGTVVNNPILIVHRSLQLLRAGQSDVRQAILESVETRIRPIFMTTITTCFGLAPLVFFPGAGSELYRGIGSVVLGGLLASTIFTLLLVPNLFALFLGVQRMFGRGPATIGPSTRFHPDSGR